MPPCSTTHVYHYLRPTADLTAILRDGLQPLSALPDHPEWAEQRHRFKPRYDELARAALDRPYQNSGVFFTPIDLRQVPRHAAVPRIWFAVPVDELGPAWTVLTYVDNSHRVSYPLSASSLQTVSDLWTADRISQSLGDSRGWFFHVPQVVAFQPGGIRVRPETLQSAPR